MSHSCPIDGTRINEPAVRVVALLVAITAVAGIWLQSAYIFLLLAFDFYVRGFNRKNLSLLRFTAIKTVKLLKVKEKHVDAGGKRFAAKTGFVFCTFLTLATLLNGSGTTLVLGSILVIFALLESVLAYCVGCKIYSLLNKMNFSLSYHSTRS